MRREIADACHMFFAAEHGLIKMRDRPALRDMRAEQLRELIDKLECCYKSIIQFQDSKDKESESK